MNETVKRMLEITVQKMDIINDIALEDDKYNDLYLELRALVVSLRGVLKAQYVIDEAEKKQEFWDDMKSFRSPDASIAEVMNTQEIEEKGENEESEEEVEEEIKEAVDVPIRKTRRV